MNRKILGFLLSLIFLFQIPVNIHAKRVNGTTEDTNKKTSQASQESTISNILSKIKNNIGPIIYTTITTGIVLFDLYLIYLFF